MKFVDKIILTSIKEGPKRPKSDILPKKSQKENKSKIKAKNKVSKSKSKSKLTFPPNWIHGRH